TLSGWAMTLQLWFGARRLGEAAQPDDRFRKRLPRTMLAAGLMGLCLWAMSWLMGDLLGQEHVRILALFVLVLGGMASFAVAALLTGAIRPSDLRAGLSRQR
ncbi:MAG: lipid II flippase MurJ, partial [Rhodobacteraceae bacterium]|nr:lipid II flippase MurJ [Paracoccaceae bacterium]